MEVSLGGALNSHIFALMMDQRINYVVYVKVNPRISFWTLSLVGKWEITRDKEIISNLGENQTQRPLDLTVRCSTDCATKPDGSNSAFTGTNAYGLRTEALERARSES